MEVQLRVCFADNSGFCCSVGSQTTAGDVAVLTGTRLGLRKEEIATLHCVIPGSMAAVPDAAICANLPSDAPDSPNLLRTLFVDLFAPRPRLYRVLQGSAVLCERFSLPVSTPPTTRAFLRLTALHLAGRALSGTLFRGPDEARASPELVHALAEYACGQLRQASDGPAELARFVRLAGLGQCTWEEGSESTKRTKNAETTENNYKNNTDSENSNSVSLCERVILLASELEYFAAHGFHGFVFRARVCENRLVPADDAPVTPHWPRCVRSLIFLGENGLDARTSDGVLFARVQDVRDLHVLSNSVFIEAPDSGLGIATEHPKDLLALLEKWLRWRCEL